MGMRHALACLVALQSGFADSAPAAPAVLAATLRNYGPISFGEDEALEMRAFNQDFRVVSPGHPAAQCRVSLYLYAPSAPDRLARRPAVTMLLSAGMAHGIDLYPSQLGFPLEAGKQYRASAVLSVVAPQPSQQGVCDKTVTANVNVVDKNTRDIRRVHDAYTEAKSQ